MAKGDFHAVNAVDSGVAGRGAAQRRHQGVGHKAHMHQMILNRFRQVEGDQNPTFADVQFTQHAHLPDSDVPPERAAL